MLIPRVIPCLLLKDNGLVKGSQFTNHKYVGDPINAVRIFSEKEADELIFLDITASKEKRIISLEFIEKVADECFMPFGVGGGINNLEQIRRILYAGAEKVCINSAAVENPGLIKEAADQFGVQSIIVSIDVKKKFFSKPSVYIHNGKTKTGYNPIDFAQKMQEMGAGEILINSIHYEGKMAGYDFELIRKVADNVDIPVIAAGGAGKLDDFKDAINQAHVSAVCAGSLFVFYGPKKAVLITFPERKTLEKLFETN